MVKRESANGVRISNWSSDVCSYDLAPKKRGHGNASSSSEKKSVAVGLVVTKPAIPPSTRRRRQKQDEPRMNALGEIKASSTRKGAVSGKSVSVRVDLGGRRTLKKNKRISVLSHQKQVTKTYA